MSAVKQAPAKQSSGKGETKSIPAEQHNATRRRRKAQQRSKSRKGCRERNDGFGTKTEKLNYCCLEMLDFLDPIMTSKLPERNNQLRKALKLYMHSFASKPVISWARHSTAKDLALSAIVDDDLRVVANRRLDDAYRLAKVRYYS